MSTKAHLLSNSYARCKLPDKSYNIQYLFRFDVDFGEDKLWKYFNELK